MKKAYVAAFALMLAEEIENKIKEQDPTTFGLISTHDCHDIIQTLQMLSNREVSKFMQDGQNSPSETFILITRATRLAVDVCYGLYHFDEQESNQACQDMLEKANATTKELAATLRQLAEVASK